MEDMSASTTAGIGIGATGGGAAASTSSSSSASSAVAAVTTTTENNDSNGNDDSQQQQQQQKQQQQDDEIIVVVGQTRVRDRKQLYSLGTIEYCGPVDGHRGTYYGIVWDDKNRGKHDGSILVAAKDGKNDESKKVLRRYFDAKHPTAGSFVRPKLVDLGRPLSNSVILERYKNCCTTFDNDDDDGGGYNKVDKINITDEQQKQEQQHTVQTVLGNTKPIEFVGRTKILRQQQWNKLTHMSLRYMGISSVDGQDELNDLRHLLHLDLAGNLFSSWCPAVFPRLLQNFPNLQHLSLAKNRFVDTTSLSLDDDNNNDVATFPNLTRLNLRDCNIQSFRTIYALAKWYLPNLQELCCAYSNISSDIIDYTAVTTTQKNIPPVMSKSLVLDATECGFESASQLQALASQCPKLVSLSLNNNPLTSFPAAATAATSWPSHLQELQLENTQFPDWKSLRPIVKLRKLQSLRFSSPALLTNNAASGAPTMAGSSSSSSSPIHATIIRMHWIAAMPSLQQYQSSTITDRKEMEQQYVLTSISSVVSKAQQQHDKGVEEEEEGNNDDEHVEGLLLPHDERYQELLEKYAELVERKRSSSSSAAASAGGDGSGSLFLSMVTVRIQSYCPSSCTIPPLIRKLPLRLTIGRLKALCARHFDLDADLQHLQWKHCGDKSTFPIDLPNDDDETTLQDCGIVDGAEILVKERELTTGSTTKPGQQLHQQKDRDDDRQALLERIWKQELERHDLDKRKAAAAAVGGGGGGAGIAPIQMTPTLSTATTTTEKTLPTNKNDVQ